MSESEVENILDPYINDDDFYLSREAALLGPGIYVSSNASGNGCLVSIRNGKVHEVQARFE